jgi:hypothetical protein
MASPPAAVDACSRRCLNHRSIQLPFLHIISYLCFYHFFNQRYLHIEWTTSKINKTTKTTNNNQHNINYNNANTNKNSNNNSLTVNWKALPSARHPALHPLLQLCLLLLTLCSSTVQSQRHHQLHTIYHLSPSTTYHQRTNHPTVTIPPLSPTRNLTPHRPPLGQLPLTSPLNSPSPPHSPYMSMESSNTYNNNNNNITVQQKALPAAHHPALHRLPQLSLILTFNTMPSQSTQHYQPSTNLHQQPTTISSTRRNQCLTVTIPTLPPPCVTTHQRHSSAKPLPTLHITIQPCHVFL